MLYTTFDHNYKGGIELTLNYQKLTEQATRYVINTYLNKHSPNAIRNRQQSRNIGSTSSICGISL